MTYGPERAPLHAERGPAGTATALHAAAQTPDSPAQSQYSDPALEISFGRPLPGLVPARLRSEEPQPGAVREQPIQRRPGSSR